MLFLFNTELFWFPAYQDVNLRIRQLALIIAGFWSDCVDVQAGIALYCWYGLMWLSLVLLLFPP